MRDRVRNGDSPASIARRHGVSVGALMGANAHKAQVVRGGRRTWQSLGVGEQLNIPVGVGDGSAAAAAIAGLISAGGPCLQKNAGFVCAIQAALGLTVDGKYGNDTANAAKRIVPGAPAGCSPAPLWWGKKGDNKCVGASIPSFPSAPIVTPVIPGLPSLPSLPVIAPIPVVTAPSAPIAAAAVAALSAIDPCLSVNAGMICAAQQALGLTPDGKYGPGTAAAVKAALGSAPAPCSPAPLWWGKKTDNKCGGGGASIPLPSPIVLPTPLPEIPVVLPPAPVVVRPAPTPSNPNPAPVIVTPAPSPVVSPSPSAPVVVAPAPAPITSSNGGDKKFSTGTIVAGAIGVAALVGLVGLGLSKGKKSGGARRSPSRKSKKKSSRKRR